LLITMGGADRQNLGLQAVQGLLAKGAEFSMRLICTAPQPGLDDAIALARQFANVQVSPPGAIERHMLQGDAALCAGGVTSLELAHLGVPSIVLILADNQRPGALALHQAGAALAMDTLENAVGSTFDLMHDPERRRAMAKAGRKLIDGKGAERILQSLVDESGH
jgi:spore coat polysaccharide biosynthesis predicted glycosyltransferase SpsG